MKGVWNDRRAKGDAPPKKATRKANPRRSEGMKKSWRLRERIVKQLAERAMSTAAVADRFRLPEAKALQYLESLRRAGRVARRKAAWTAIQKEPKQLLSHEQRSEIAIAAAQIRLQGEQVRRRADRRLLGLPAGAPPSDITKAFRAARRRLRLPPKTQRPALREALRAERKATTVTLKAMANDDTNVVALRAGITAAA
jgi:hypothetical protein